MKLSISPPPFAARPSVVTDCRARRQRELLAASARRAGAGVSGGVLRPAGTGDNPDTLPEDYTLAHMADELALALAGQGSPVTAWSATRWGRWWACGWPSISPTPLPRWSASTAG